MRLPLLGLLAVCMLLPVTLPVPVLRALVHDRFAVSELATSFFMSINMIAAVLVAPVAGALSDRLGRRKPLIVGALALDALLFFGMTLDLPFPAFMALRFFEGGAHIFALSLLLALGADSAAPERRGRVMGVLGGGLTFGVAMGAPIGQALGRLGPLVVLEVGAVLLALTAGLAALALRDAPTRERRASVLAVVRAAARDRALLVPFLFAFVDRFTVGFFTTTFSLYVTNPAVFATPPAVLGWHLDKPVGLLLALFLIPFSLLSYPFGRLSERVSRSALMGGGSVLYGIGCVTLGFWPGDALWLLMLLLGVASAVMFVPSLVMTTDLASKEAKATALGGFNAAGSLGFIVGPLVGGLVSQTVAASSGWKAGYQAAFATAGASEVLCVAVALPFLIKLRRAGRTT